MPGAASSAAYAGSEATAASNAAARTKSIGFLMKNLLETGNREQGPENNCPVLCKGVLARN
jgi:hypothetical protein